MIKVNDRTIDYWDGMSVFDALNEAGDSFNKMTIIVVNGRVVPYNQMRNKKLDDRSEIKLYPIVSGG